MDIRANPNEFLMHIPKLIDEETNKHLSREVFEKKVMETVWYLHPEKALGPDLFPISFYHTFWHVIKKVCHQKEKVGGFTNSTFIALIPKYHCPSSLNRFFHHLLMHCFLQNHL